MEYVNELKPDKNCLHAPFVEKGTSQNENFVNTEFMKLKSKSYWVDAKGWTRNKPLESF